MSLILAASLAFGSLANVAYATTNKDKDTLVEKNIAEKQAHKVLNAQDGDVSAMNEYSYGMISTSYIQCYIHSNGVFNIGTADGDCLLYNFPDSTTSETMIRINSSDYFFDDYVNFVSISADRKSCVATAYIDEVLVTQTTSIVRNANSSTENVVSIRYTCENQSSENKTIGVRIMMDTMLGNNDGAPFRVNGVSVTKELEFRGSSIPQVYQAYDSLTDTSLTATGYFYYNASEKPDKVQFAYWPNVRGASWNYTIDPSDYLTSDSAVLAYFNEKSVAPGGSVSAGTYYGAYQTGTASSFEDFPYTNDSYYQELAEICGRYAALAYQDYIYDESIDLFYDVKDNAKKDVKKNNRSKVLNDALMKDNYQDIVSANYKEPTEDSATYTLAHKKVNYNGAARDLILVVVRGTNKDEWQGNMNVTGTEYNDQSYHDSFQNGATQIESHLMRYMNTYTSISNPMVLITGHSRGGAIGNLLAADLTNDRVERIDENSVFAYLFAVPNVSTDVDTSMTNIYNFCFKDDFVPNLPLNNRWGYGKNGQTFFITADEQTNPTFLTRVSLSVGRSEGEFDNERNSFDAAKTRAVIDYVGNTWRTVYAYYEQEHTGGTTVDTMYDFMHDVVAKAAMGNPGAKLRLKNHTGNESKNVYTKIANFFVDGWGMRACVNDNHQMFNYYNALVCNLFPTTSATAERYYNSPATVSAESDPALEQAALIAFANTGSNLALLGWDLDDTDTWTGITWNDDGCVSSIDLCYLSLTGTLDLSAFNALTRVDVSGNELDGLILPGSDNSVLNWVDCSYNNLTELNISSRAMELLDCSNNYLDEAAMTAAAENVTYASCGSQKPTEEIVYSAEDCETLTENVLTNDQIWDTSASPDTWTGVRWEAEDGTYYVTGLNLSDCGLTGELDVSALDHLEILQCSGNEITSINATDCDALTFINCNANSITEITVSESAELSNVSCTDNFLSADTLANLNAEMVNTGHQQVDADISDFSTAEMEVLAPIAEELGYDSEVPGEWYFVTWEKQNGIYHATSLDLSNTDVSGDLDLSAFAYLNNINCASTAITSVTLPNGMTELNEYAFYNCTALEDVTMPDSLTEIGAYAFSNCTALKDVIFPAGLKALANGAFDSCTALEQICFPVGFESIGVGTFQNCTSLRTAYFTGNAPACGDNAFMYASVGFTVFHLTDTTGWDNVVWGSYISDVLTRLSVISHPDKLTYNRGEALDLDGLKVLYLSNNGTYEILTSGFTVDCEPLDAAGDYVVTLSYNGASVSFTVTVRALSIQNGYAYIESSEYNYTGEEIRPEVVVEYDDTRLVEGTDYTVEYSNNINAGRAYIYITGIGNYEGQITLNFQILFDVTVTDWTELESPHPYDSNSNMTWTYTAPYDDVEYLELTFDEQTSFETGYDTLGIFDGNGELIDYYSSQTLAGQTIRVQGATVKLNLTSDSSVQEWGFKVTNLRAVRPFAVSNDKVTGKPVLEWSSVEGAQAYQLYRSEQGADNYTCIATVTDQFTYTDPDAVVGTTYSYYMVAVDEESNILMQSTVCNQMCVCAQPVAKTATFVASGKIKISWNRVDGAVKYHVYRTDVENGTFTKLTSTTGTSVSNTKVNPGTTYYYYVVAEGANGAMSEPSEIVSRTCILARPEVTLSNVTSTGKIQIKWNAVAGATKYKVYIYDANGKLLKTSTTAKTSLIHSSAAAGVTYTYKVRALNNDSAATSSASEGKSKIAKLAQPVVTLSNVASSGKVKVSWKKVSGAVKYEVYRATSKNGTYTKITTTKNTSITNTKTDAGKTYYYKVKAVASKSAANSAFSAVKSLTCDLARPTVSITTSSGKPTISWKKVSGATKYQVYRATSKNGTYKAVKTLTGLKFKDTTAKKGTTYYYKVVAVSKVSSANSAYSNVVSIKATK